MCKEWSLKRSEVHMTGEKLILIRGEIFWKYWKQHTEFGIPLPGERTTKTAVDRLKIILRFIVTGLNDLTLQCSWWYLAKDFQNLQVKYLVDSLTSMESLSVMISSFKMKSKSNFWISFSKLDQFFGLVGSDFGLYWKTKVSSPVNIFTETSAF